MKGYQISQYDEPICVDGWLDLPTETPHRVGINRVHMEGGRCASDSHRFSDRWSDAFFAGHQPRPASP